jgi:hypothetical protein
MAAPGSDFHKVMEFREVPAPGMTVRRKPEYNRVSLKRLQPTLSGSRTSETLVLFFGVSI